MKYAPIIISIILLGIISIGNLYSSVNTTYISSEKYKPQDFDKKKAVLHIREIFNKINKAVATAEIFEKNIEGESTEGGSVKAYKHNNEIIKIVYSVYGEMGKATDEYYFENGKLIFVFTQEFQYNMPMYMEESKISKTIENRYYFYNEKLFLWLDPDKNEIDLNKAENTSQNLLEDVNKLIESL
jgi:hypothetical protein